VYRLLPAASGVRVRVDLPAQTVAVAGVVDADAVRAPVAVVEAADPSKADQGKPISRNSKRLREQRSLFYWARLLWSACHGALNLPSQFLCCECVPISENTAS
jgi:hypothetical protein